MRTLIQKLGYAAALLALAAASQPLHAASPTPFTASTKIPGLNPKVLALALTAADAAVARLEVAKPELLTVIDYSLPSTDPRMWVLDRATGKVLWHELVAHGKGTGENYAKAFSNREGSRQSSLGLYLTEEPYQGGNGCSLRLRGLERGINHEARPRSIVMHGAPYVSHDFIRAHGRLGRSWGCPALRPEINRQVIDRIKHGSLLFVYYPDAGWLDSSGFLGTRAGSVTTAG